MGTTSEALSAGVSGASPETAAAQKAAMLAWVEAIAPYGIFTTDAQLKVRTWNRRAQQRWGRTRQEVLRRQIGGLDLDLPMDDLLESLHERSVLAADVAKLGERARPSLQRVFPLVDRPVKEAPRIHSPVCRIIPPGPSDAVVRIRGGTRDMERPVLQPGIAGLQVVLPHKYSWAWPHASQRSVILPIWPRSSGGTGFSPVIARSAQNQFERVAARSCRINGNAWWPMPMISW